VIEGNVRYIFQTGALMLGMALLPYAVRRPRRAFAPGVAVNTCPVAPGRTGEHRCRRGTFYLCDVRMRNVAWRAG